MKLLDTVAALAAPVIEKHGLRLWDVEFVKEGGEQYLRLYIDKPGGVTIDDCEAVSREMDKLLDEADPIRDPYIFEVSSAGAERALKRPSDFEEFTGSMVTLRTFSPKNGKKEFIGTLSAYYDGDVVLNINEESITFLKKEIAIVRLYAQF